MKRILLAAAVSLVAAAASAQAGDPIPGLDVVLKAVPGGAIVSAAKTDAKGTFTFQKLAPGEYTVTLGPVGTQLVIGGSAEKLEIRTAREAGSGMATGKRQHGAITITKQWGAANRTVNLTHQDDWFTVTVTAAKAPMGKKPE